MNSKTYIRFDPNEGYPARLGLFYECHRCGEAIASIPHVNSRCKCRNIVIDVDYGRIRIQDHSQVRLYFIENK